MIPNVLNRHSAQKKSVKKLVATMFQAAKYELLMDFISMVQMILEQFYEMGILSIFSQFSISVQDQIIFAFYLVSMCYYPALFLEAVNNIVLSGGKVLDTYICTLCFYAWKSLWDLYSYLVYFLTQFQSFIKINSFSKASFPLSSINLLFLLFINVLILRSNRICFKLRQLGI